MNVTKILGLLTLSGLVACTAGHSATTSDWARTYDQFEPSGPPAPRDADTVVLRQATSVEELLYEPQYGDYSIIGQARYVAPVEPEKAWPDPEAQILPHAANRGADVVRWSWRKVAEATYDQPATYEYLAVYYREPYPWPAKLSFVNAGPNRPNNAVIVDAPVDSMGFDDPFDATTDGFEPGVLDDQLLLELDLENDLD